jgi:hypothetical protein
MPAVTSARSPLSARQPLELWIRDLHKALPPRGLIVSNVEIGESRSFTVIHGDPGLGRYRPDHVSIFYQVASVLAHLALYSKLSIKGPKGRHHNAR